MYAWNRFTFTIAGETDTGNPQNYRQAIERMLTPEERRRVWFPGPLSRKQLFPLYFTSTLFLFPSLFENSPYALLEAMTAGLPVIAASGGGIPEIVTHDETGLLFQPDNREELVTNIRSLYRDRSRAAVLGRNAREAVQRMFDPDQIITEHCDFYRATLAVCS